MLPNSLTDACIEACRGNNWSQRLPNFLSLPNSFGKYSNDREFVSAFVNQIFDGYKPKRTENHLFDIVDNVVVSYHDEPECQCGLWYPHNRINDRSFKQLPFAGLAPLYEEYSAIQLSVVTYNVSKGLSWLNAQMPTFGLVDRVLIPGIVSGTHTRTGKTKTIPCPQSRVQLTIHLTGILSFQQPSLNNGKLDTSVMLLTDSGRVLDQTRVLPSLFIASVLIYSMRRRCAG